MPSNRQLAAIMFADIVGYTALMQKDEASAMNKLHSFKEELSIGTKRYHGEIMQYYGDGCLMIFPNATNAVACAKHLQEEFRYRHEVPVRIGIHSGEIVLEEGNIFGDSVNVSSRIESMGVAGSVLLSDAVRNQVKNKPEFILTSLGRFEFKNVDEPMEVFALANEGFTVPDRSSLSGKFRDRISETKEKEEKLKQQVRKKKVFIISAVLLAVMAGTYFIILKNEKPSEITQPGTTAAIIHKSIAVLPFTDMSPDKTQEHLGDGLADDIISALSGIPDLKVIGRTSSFQFKGAKADLREIGDKLGVTTVLEGSVQKSGNTIRITAQLINVADGSHIWSEKWDRDMTDIFKVQDEIANGIKEKLKISLQVAARKTITVSPEAYENFLKGRRLLLTNIPGNVKQARDYFLFALKSDSSFTDAMALLSLSYFRLGTQIYPWIEMERRQKAIDSAFRFARQALSLDDNSSVAHLAMGSIYAYNYEWEKTEQEYRRAHEINPGTLEKNFLVDFLNDMGGFEEAYKLASDALLIDPLDINSMISYAMTLNKRGQYDSAIYQLEKVIKIDSTSMKANSALGHNYHQVNKDKECLAAWARQHEINGNKELAHIYRTSDFKTAMQAWIKQAATPNAPFGSGEYVIALIYSYFKDKENTIKYLQLAAANQRPNIISLKTNKNFDFIRDDPRYKELYRQLRFDKYDEYKKKQQ